MGRLRSQHKAFLLLLALVTVAFFWLLLPFYGAVFWAVILAIVFQPLQRAPRAPVRRPRSNLAAASACSSASSSPSSR